MHVRRDRTVDEDVFVSMGSSTHDARSNNAEDPLDDVFGADPDSPVFEEEDETTQLQRHQAHPSDIPRLQAEHTTAGYREGITAAKAQSIQAGFDEGFSLGATIGLKAGEVLGLLEGIAAAFIDGRSDASNHATRLLSEARKELSTEQIYGQEFWKPDGTWRFEVKPGADECDILFEDVASHHPAIRKWIAIANQEVERWSIKRSILDQPESSQAKEAEKKQIKVEQQSREALDW